MIRSHKQVYVGLARACCVILLIRIFYSGCHSMCCGVMHVCFYLCPRIRWLVVGGIADRKLPFCWFIPLTGINELIAAGRWMIFINARGCGIQSRFCLSAAIPIMNHRPLILTWVCVCRPPAACRYVFENQLSGTLPSELGALTILSIMCVEREGEGLFDAPLGCIKLHPNIVSPLLYNHGT